jgi:hypothetical protein
LATLLSSEAFSSPLITFASRDELNFITATSAALISANHSFKTSSLAAGWSEGMLGFRYALDQGNGEIAIDFNAALGGAEKRGEAILVARIDAIEPV